MSFPFSNKGLTQMIGAAQEASASPAAPTAEIGPTAKPGTATTYMRSDAAPALAPTGVTAGSYTHTALTVDAQGRITEATSGTDSTGVNSITFGSTGLTVTPPAGTGDVAVAGTLAVGNGGTGAITLTDGGVILGSGTGAVTSLAQATNGQLVVGSTSADPVLANLTGSSAVSVTDGAGSITLDLTTTGAGGSYTSADITVDAQGRITAAANGASGTMSSFTATGNSGTQNITEGKTLSVQGASGLGLTLNSAMSGGTITMTPSAGTLNQANGGTGVDFSSTADGNLLIGAAAGVATLGVITGTPFECKVTNGTNSIEIGLVITEGTTSGSLVYYDASSGFSYSK